jgi:Domain of unknown function (DUF4388)
VDRSTDPAYDPGRMHGGDARDTMTELSGTLEGVGLPAIVRFLTGLKKTGCLRLVHQDWQGEIVFEAGQLTGASLGSRHGLSALDALVEVLPGGSFTFDTSAQGSGVPSIELSPEALRTHLDELVARVATGARRLPSPDEVPVLLAQDDSGGGEEPLPLDRGTLQTLLAIDGQRTVREIVAHRGSFDALWQLGNLVEVGLVGVVASSVSAGSAAETAPTPVSTERPPVERAREHCPKLGFEDDPANSFDRPTRLHRCFAASTPLPLSVDQQRELCLTDQFGTCPRLSMVGPSDAVVRARAKHDAPTPDAPTPMGRAGNTAPAVGMAGQIDPLPIQPEGDDPRIVRLPFAGRNRSSSRGGAGDRQRFGSSEPSQLPSASSALRSDDSPRPTPLRARMERANNAAGSAAARAAFEPGTPPTAEARSTQPKAVRALVEDGALSPFAAVPVRLIVGIVVLLMLLAMSAFLVVPHLGELFVDDNADLSGLPNASAVAAGTPVAEIAARLTPVANIPSQGDGTSAGAASAAAAPAVPNLAPEAARATAEPAPTNSQSPAGRSSVSVSPASASPAAIQAGNPESAQSATAPLLDESFANNARNWPSNPQGTAWLTSGSYRLIPRQVGQFVAIGAPLADALQDVVVSATFRKLSGTPAGGGFGIIVRDQGPAPRDGQNQGGRYYVLEVGDKGEVGIWRREVDHWVDLLPWQHADAVHPGTATNELTVSAIGDRLSLSVNGAEIVTRTDDTYSTGSVGLLAGGDGNQVAVDHFTVHTP